ncbi:ATP-binding domain protein, partial [Vibrio harveyi]
RKSSLSVQVVVVNLPLANVLTD